MQSWSGHFDQFQVVYSIWVQQISDPNVNFLVKIAFMLKKITIIIILPCVWLIGSFMPACAEIEHAFEREYEIKAAFIYNFAKFVEWPENKFTDAKAPLVLGILGNSPFGAALESLETKTVRGRQLTIRQVSASTNLSQCHMLYICKSEIPELKRIIEHLGGQPILTISDIQDFAKSGGHINLVIRQNKIRFIINTVDAKKANLKISSRLLKLSINN